MEGTEETKPAELPNGPAKVVTDNKKERFKLEYGGSVVFQAAVKLIRDDQELTFKDAGARLFVVSKFEGWDVVTQTIRVAAVAVKPGDRIVVRGHGPDTGTGDVTALVDDAGGLTCVYSTTGDWALCVEPGPDAVLGCEDVAVKGAPESTVQRHTVTAQGTEVVLRFRPYFGKRHGETVPASM